MNAQLIAATAGAALLFAWIVHRRLPDAVLLPTYVLTVILLLPAGAATADWYAAARALAGMGALLLMFFALAMAYPNGLGFDDVKLAGLIGLYLGWFSWTALFVAAAGSLLIACAGGTVAVVTNRTNRNAAVPICPCLVSAAILALFLAAPIGTWYGSLLSI